MDVDGVQQKKTHETGAGSMGETCMKSGPKAALTNSCHRSPIVYKSPWARFFWASGLINQLQDNPPSPLHNLLCRLECFWFAAVGVARDLVRCRLTLAERGGEVCWIEKREIE